MIMRDECLFVIINRCHCAIVVMWNLHRPECAMTANSNAMVLGAATIWCPLIIVTEYSMRLTNLFKKQKRKRKVMSFLFYVSKYITLPLFCVYYFLSGIVDELNSPVGLLFVTMADHHKQLITAPSQRQRRIIRWLHRHYAPFV